MDTTLLKELSPLNLLSPPAAQTDSSIAFVWDKPSAAKEVAGYRIYLNGKQHGIATCTDYTAEELESGQVYEAYVCAFTSSGAVSRPSAAIRVSTKPEAERFDITRFGSAADGETVNTAAIQAAIDACTPGGKVVVPAGIFVTGALFLKSNMTLFLEKGAVLMGSGEPSHYPVMRYRWEGREQPCYASLINTRDCPEGRLSHITIEGEGTINANGVELFKKEMADKLGFRGRAVCLRNVDYVYLKGITVRQSPAWCVHPIYCNHVTINKIEIHTKYDEFGKRYENIFNGDGLDPDSCQDMYIFHSVFVSQDDCIAIKSGRDEEGRAVGIPSRNFRITNCTFKSGFGVAMGSEMAGGVRDVVVRDCTFEDAFSIASVKAPRGRGAIIDHIRY